MAGHHEEKEDVETQWNTMHDSMTKAAEEVLPKKKREQKQKWMTTDIIHILQKMEEHKRAKTTNPLKYNQIKKEVARGEGMHKGQL